MTSLVLQLSMTSAIFVPLFRPNVSTCTLPYKHTLYPKELIVMNTDASLRTVGQKNSLNCQKFVKLWMYSVHFGGSSCDIFTLFTIYVIKLFSFVSLKVFVTRLYLFACIMWVYASVPVLTGVMVTFYVLLKFFDSFV